MEVELFSCGVSEEDTVEVDTENDYFGESERCGICMDVVVDRGVLDCCQHWFCFVCIDNWASITNLCPLCQNEFQLITCIPVYDTIGGNKTDENSDLSDNDWCVEGKNNTLSFPSYYIDENAVTCLDGDGCKIRGGSVTNEETLTLDTSIACDSCDLWYHAFCVGFDPEGADVDSWLCPRCLVSETHQNSAFKGTYLLQNQIDSESADHSCLVDTSSGKVSISVADDGETAVVVSRIGGENFVEEPIANGIPTQELTNHCETEMSVLGPDSCSSELKQNSLDQGIKATQPEPTTPVTLHVSLDESEPIGSGSGLCLDPGSSLDATLSEEEKTKVLSGDDKCPQGASGKTTSTDETSEDIKADLAPKVGTKRKCTDYSFLTNDEDKSDEVQLGSGLTRKVKSHPCASLNEPAHISAPEDHQNTNNWVESSVDEMGRNVPAKKPLPIDIMSIVRDKEPKTTKKLMRQKETDKCPKVQQNAARLRVKKIMRRSSEDQKAADVVQELRKEIREAVQKRPSDDMGKNIFDPNLLAAFRAAVTGSAAAPVKKAPMKAKKLVLQKGKTRENLTKKIYATSSGKRRRAWDRDCQVEFWKHRCMTTSKPEKIETLRSVLNLLKRSPETKQVEQDSEEEANAPILSRLYLADASVFPRKDDIKPLSVLKAAAGSKQNDEPSSGEKDAKASQNHSNVGCPNSNEVLTLGTVAADDKNIENTCNHNNGFASAKAHSDKQSVRSSSQNTTACKTDMKLDKRKWALAVLARKTASNSSSSVHQKQDNAVFSGNYPLLAELPADMRPELAPIRHNKIPVSVRQAQLYRLTEHFLKMSNLSSIHRTAATELSVADAINIEKQVAERANSKVVYMNLCSQEVRHRTMCHSSRTPVESKPSRPLPVPDEGGEPSKSSLDSEGGQPSKLSLDSEALEALRNAGLLSDSPPCSPDHYVKDAHDNGNPDVEVDEEGMKDIFEMDSQPDLDIYGDFEYDLDEEFYTDASAIKASKSQATDGESKMKVVFSTLTSNKTDWSVEGNEGDLLEAEQLSNTSKLLGSCNDTGIGSSATDNNDTSADIEDEELSIRECEELYGPDKEPLVNKFSAVLSSENSAPQSVDNEEVKNPEENNLVSTSCKVVADGGKSSSSSRAVENAQDKKNGDSKVDKKSGHVDSVQKKVEAYIKEHIRPLCKSGVITVEQYRWAVGKTTDKVMKYHSKAKNANFLIKEGEKVKKLAEQYVEAANHKENK